MTQALPLFYSSVEVINRDAHQRAGIRRSGGYSFARGSHLVPCVAEEFAAGSREMPIVFVKEGTAILPVFLVGLRSNANAYIDSEGRWDGRYIPAYLRRYPFIVGQAEGAQPVLCVEPESLTFDGDGEALFEADGKNSPLLEQTMKLAVDYAAASKATEALIFELTRLNLIEPVQLKAVSEAGETFIAEGLHAVSEMKLGLLDDAAFLSLRKSGALVAIYAHLFSLGLVDSLVKRVTAKSRPAGT